MKPEIRNILFAICEIHKELDMFQRDICVEDEDDKLQFAIEHYMQMLEHANDNLREKTDFFMHKYAFKT